MPKDWGGLGLRTARNINQASMMKAVWDFSVSNEDLWVKVVRSKYRCGRVDTPSMFPSKAGSNLWRGLCGAWKDVQHHLIWRYGRGSNINVWDSCWIPNKGKLSHSARGPLTAMVASITVADLVNDQGGGVLKKSITSSHMRFASTFSPFLLLTRINQGIP